VESSGYIDWLLLDGLGIVVCIATDYGLNGWGAYGLQRLATDGRAVERSGYI